MSDADSQKQIWTAAEIADFVRGRLQGDPKICIDQVAGLDTASNNELSFLANPRYRKLVSRSKAGIIIIPTDFTGEPPEGTAWIQVDDPNRAFTQVVERMMPDTPEPVPGIHPDATVDESSQLGEGVSIGPQAVIEPGVTVGDGSIIGAGVYIGHDTVIGKNCRFYSNVSICNRTVIGNRVIIHCNSVVGSDGFGYEPDVSGHKKVPQLGTVQIDDDVEIGSCTTIDRARFGRTWIQSDVKIDNLCQIAHNVVIGRGSFLMSQTGISGSTSIGKFVALFGQSGLPGHIHVGDFAKILGGSAPIDDVPENAELVGFPAVNRNDYFRQMAALRRLPNTLKQIRALERRIQELESQLDDDTSE